MTKPACRLGDQANCPADGHGKDCCSHNVTGPAVSASPDVLSTARRPCAWGTRACTALCILLLAVALVLLPFIRAAVSEDKITIILNNKITEDKNAEDFPLFYRYKKK